METGARRFPETHWSRVIKVANASDPHHAEHLNGLLRRYWKPVYHYVRALRSFTREEAEDVTQGFFEMVLHRVDFATLSPDRGSFRGYLKTAVQRFVSSHERKGAVRGRIQQSANFPFGEAESVFQSDETITPEESFDRSWAREVIAEGLGRLRDELVADGKANYFEIFRQYTLEPAEGVSYDTLAEIHGLRVHDVRNYLSFVRARGSEILQELLGEYLFPGESMEEELRFIFQD